MPDYGVGGPDWVPLPWTWAADRLAAARNYWISTVSAAGQPHALPVWGVWDDVEMRFMFSCATTAAKARHLATNPLLTFAPESTVECLSVQGRADRLAAGERLEWWVARYVAKYGDEIGAGLADFIRSNAVFEVTPTIAFGVIERADEFSTRATRWRFTG
jgi:hypothetical protein